METWNKIFETVGFFWLLMCFIGMILTIIMIVGSSTELIYVLVNLVCWPAGWFGGSMILKFFRDSLGSIWFEKK